MSWIPNQTNNKHLMKYDVECDLHVEYITTKSDKNGREQMYFKLLNPDSSEPLFKTSYE